MKKYCEGASVPWNRKVPERTSVILTADIVTFIHNYLTEDATQGIRK